MSDERRLPASLAGVSRRQRRAAARAARRASTRGALPTAGAALALSLGLQPSDAHANTFEVTNLNDSGAGSLRQALADANANQDADTITFHAGLTGTITLASKLSITGPVDIQGPGASNVSVSGNNAVPVFYLYDTASAAPVDITISGLTITDGKVAGGGDGGGGIVDRGEDLVVDSAVISGNDASGTSGAGIMVRHHDASLTIRNSVISGNTCTNCVGGGVYFNSAQASYDGELKIENSEISGNTAGTGGGVALYGCTVAVENSTISGNQAAFSGGIDVESSRHPSSIRLSTISGNTASSAGGGIRLYNETLTVENSIIADNSSPTQADVGTNKAMLAANYSLIEAVSTATITGAHNITGMDPELGALADNGGPTQTQMPAPTSPAIDAGDPAFSGTPNVDQRGRTRVAGSAVDMGALEFNRGTLQCSMAAVSVSEGADMVVLSVTRLGGGDGAASVDIETMDGTATDGTDYTHSMATLQWSANDMAAKTLNVPITDDDVVEGDETFSAALSNATGATLGATTSVTVLIDDDDAAPKISAIADQTIDENDSSDALKFTISDADDDIADLVVSAKSSKHSLLADDDITLGGSGTRRTVKVTPLADKTGKVDVTITVSDGTNSTTMSFTVTVKAVTEPGPDAGMMEPPDAGAQPDAGGGSGGGGSGGSGSGGNPSTGEDASTGGSGGEDASTAAPGSDAGEPDAGGEKLGGGGDDCGCSTVGASKRPSGVVIGGLLALFGATSRRRRRKLGR